MDESHRLKPMVENYDRKLFNELYKQTKDLRKKLAWGIDSRKYGVDYFEILSWFDIKFIHAFNRYYNDDRCKDKRETVLKGFIISSLSMYKSKLVRDSYNGKQELNQTVDITELFSYDSLLIEEMDSEDNSLYNSLNKYLRDRLSPMAYMVFNIELNPPPYILKRISNPKQNKIPKLSTEILADYLGMDDLEEAKSYLKALHKEIEDIKKQAKQYFSLYQPALS